MGKHHEQRLSLFEGACLAFIQLLVATLVRKELIKFGFQGGGLGRIRMVAVVQEALIQLPKTFVERLQELRVVAKAGDQFLIVAIFVNPTQGKGNRERIELGSIVTD
jgi:hypothetical protein